MPCQCHACLLLKNVGMFLEWCGSGRKKKSKMKASLLLGRHACLSPSSSSCLPPSSPPPPSWKACACSLVGVGAIRRKALLFAQAEMRDDERKEGHRERRFLEEGWKACSPSHCQMKLEVMPWMEMFFPRREAASSRDHHHACG